MRAVSQVAAWPRQRGCHASLVAQFGADRADLAAWALMTADPLADAVAAEMSGGDAKVQADFRLGLANGLASLANPPASVEALLREAERRPDYVDDALLDQGAEPFYSMPVPVHIISLSAGALIRTYESPSIAAVLVSTGRLVDGADRRIRETGKWLATSMLPGALRVGQPGYVATVKVRMLHAHMRRAARERGFDEAAYGVPINQIDLARTWMDFTLTSWRAEAAMGFGLTSREAASLYRYWWHVGHLLGIDPQLIEGIASHAQAERVDALIQAVTGPLVPESASLAAATIASISRELRNIIKLPTSVGVRGLEELARRFHGEAIADELDLGRNPITGAIINRAVGAIRQRRVKARRNPERWAATIAKNIADTRAQLAGDTEPAQYETHREPPPP